MLLERRAQHESKTCTAEELEEAENAAIAAAVSLQESIGLKTITDGEMRRGAFYEGIFEKFEGMETILRPIETFKAYLPYVHFFVAAGLKQVPSIFTTGKIHWPHGGVYVKDFVYLKGLVSPQNVKNLKITVCGPTWMHLRHGPEDTYDTSVYKSDAAYFADLVHAYREEFRALYAEGCRNIQFDDPTFAFFCVDSTIEGMEKAGVDSEKLFDTYINVYNAILKDRPADLTVGVHTCRGNYKGMHYCEGGYDRIARKYFTALNVDCYYLEYDNERSGGFEPLKHLPLNKVAVLGLITTKDGKLESLEDLQDSVNEVVDILVDGSPKRSRAYALNQLCISPQCGFASVAEGNPITEEEQRRKLTLVLEAARGILE